MEVPDWNDPEVCLNYLSRRLHVQRGLGHMEMESSLLHLGVGTNEVSLEGSLDTSEHLLLGKGRGRKACDPMSSPKKQRQICRIRMMRCCYEAARVNFQTLL